VHRRIAAVVLVALVAVARPASADPPCIPLAQVSGDPALVATVTRVLYERGLSSSGSSACGTVSAEVAPRDERVWIRLTDADGRTVERVADDGEGAATTIESWTRQDVVDPLLAARETMSAVTPPPAGARRPAVQSTGVVSPSSRAGWELSALGVAALSDDGALWSGVRAQFSARVAMLSLGGRVGVALDTGAVGVTGAGCARQGTGDFAYRDAEPGCDTSRVAPHDAPVAGRTRRAVRAAPPALARRRPSRRGSRRRLRDRRVGPRQGLRACARAHACARGRGRARAARERPGPRSRPVHVRVREPRPDRPAGRGDPHPRGRPAAPG
jgi:hypothetical protein